MSDPASSEEELFVSALAQPRTQRTAFLAAACAGQPALRARLTQLLAAHDGASSFLETPAGDDEEHAARAAPLMVEERPGDRIARYKLLQKIGEGGCGVVHLAEQQEPVQRRVALKVIKLGMDTKAVIARFEAERQALALMDHPNIAKVLDAGATEAGRPFFVMELVRGVPITKYCDEHNVITTARLQLFIQVCHAIQHAHQKGIIHRDIKPSNILVTLHDGQPVPKVIDFGIAKATQGKLTDATVFTAFEQFIGTPAYMSPEQAEMSGFDIDTRSDVYSLGVLLYELLSGRPPFDPRSLLDVGVDEIRRIIREVDPPRPSTRLSTLNDADQATVAKLRGTAPAQLATLLRGDLDWIAMRCLEKDRTRRYETANALAADLQRHIANEPVAARPPSTAYLLQKLVHRHRLAFGAGAAVLFALLAGTAASTWQAIRARQAERLAEARLHSELAAREEVEAQRKLALDRLAAETAARQETERQKTLAEQERNRALTAERLAADRAQSELLARRDAEQQKTEAEQQRTLADRQRALAEQERNRAQEAEKSAQNEAARSAEAVRLMQSMLKGAGPHVALVSDPKRLHRVLDQTAQRLVTEPAGTAQADLRDALSAVYYDLGAYATSAAIRGRWASKDHPPLAAALGRLGRVLLQRGWLPEAEVVLRDGLTVNRLVTVSGTGPSAGSSEMLADLAEALRKQGRAENAAALEPEPGK